ncbi:MAG: hypothetical protein GXO69_01520 [Acidobacteria bacterium]|nr:hypothetical protein [Acidobacteriota bacterium]
MFREILNDRISGSSQLLEAALNWLEKLAASQSPLPDGALERLLNVHRGMACFYHLKRFFSENDLSVETLTEFRRGAGAEEKNMLDAFRNAFPAAVGRTAVYSNSGMVAKALAVLNRPLEVNVALCAPEGEGRAMARSLAEIPELCPLLLPDGAYFSRIADVQALVIGCDAVSPGFIVNRSGTRAVVRLAAAAGIPVFVVPGALKMLSDGEILAMPLKQGGPPAGDDSVKWENPMLERLRTENITVIGRD